MNKSDIDKKSFGSLLNEQHNILNNFFNVSTSKIELMLKSALDAGAYGGNAGRNANSGGGGGSGYTDGSVTIVSSQQGGNTSSSASATIKLS